MTDGEPTRSARAGMADQSADGTKLLQRLAEPGLHLSVELRPPRAGLTRGASMETWIDLFHAFRGFAAHDAYVFVTDNAVGEAEEENLQHFTSNLTSHLDPARLIPFLTCKHTVEYCQLYATRARARGVEALTVVGGDDAGGPERCVAHAYELRRILRDLTPDLTLGGWVNPHADPDRQASFVGDPEFDADYFLTQIVSHHDLDKVEALLGALEKTDFRGPSAYGVFYYPHAHPRLLKVLGEYFPVPTDPLTREFEAGATPAEVCARSILGLRSLGIENFYISNLGGRSARRRYEAVLAAVERLEDSESAIA